MHLQLLKADPLVDWNELTPEPHEGISEDLYATFVELAFSSGEARPLMHAPPGMRATTLPVAELGADPRSPGQWRELYIVEDRAYLECVPSVEGPSAWYDLGMAPH